MKILPDQSPRKALLCYALAAIPFVAALYINSSPACQDVRFYGSLFILLYCVLVYKGSHAWGTTRGYHLMNAHGAISIEGHLRVAVMTFISMAVLAIVFSPALAIIEHFSQGQ